MKKPQLDPLRIVEAEFTAAAQNVDNLPASTGIEIAFAGRSNVGKSSLMNALCGRKNLVRISSTPGCTRQIAFFSVRTADNVSLTLVDLPGYGYAKRSKTERSEWAQMIESYLMGRSTLSVMAALVDCRRGVQESDLDLVELMKSPSWVTRPEVKLLSVCTKLDKLPFAQQKRQLQAVGKALDTQAAGVSVRQPESVQQLWRRLRLSAGISPQQSTRGQ